MKQTQQIVLSAVLISIAACGQAAATGAAAMNRPSRTVFRDCPACPEMVVILAGSFTMGSSPAEQQWAATHGGTLKSVADESPQHAVTLQSFALSRYPVTRGDYAASFMRRVTRPVMDADGPHPSGTRKPPSTGRTPGSIKEIAIP
jgi:formylglycine-generating enzyme required for sulfatase activity